MEGAARIVLSILTSYMLGAVPFSYIMGRLLRGIDLREHGSGNLGAANTFRVLGSRAAVPVLLADIGKGFLAVRLVPVFGLEAQVFVLLAALIVILGHNYSVFLRFSGGKGVGTTTGAFLAMAPVAVGICFALWVIVLAISRVVSVASMTAAVMLPVSVVLSEELFGRDLHPSILYLAVLVTVIVIYKHRSNIRRLREGTERKIF